MSDNEYVWYTPLTDLFMRRDGGYLVDGQCVDDRVGVIGDTVERRLGRPGLARKFKQYFKRGWYSLSTPIWTNFGTDRGLPISCYNSHISDSIESILGGAHAEIAQMTKNGGGTSAYFGDVRGRGSDIKGGLNGKSFGSVHFAGHYQSLIQTCSQGSTRRGNFAGYWPIDHPDIMEVLRIKQEGSPVQHISYGVCVGDAWLDAMVKGDRKKREVWAAVIEARKNTGFPYILFVDTVNNARPQWYKDQGLFVKSSNLCVETTPTSNEFESFVCDLSSLNILHYDGWKDTDAPELLVYVLDAVMDEFIEKASGIPYMSRAVLYARRHRSLGIGWFGWHHYLQSKMVPFESAEAMRLNAEVALTIQKKTVAASEQMAREYGEPEVTRGYGRRHALLQAVAPTTSSSFIIGQASESVEPVTANYEVKDLAKGKFTVINPFLLRVLDAHGKNDQATLDSVLAKGGSVQHLDFLSERERAVFRTFPEISQQVVVDQAAQRQRFIDQGQSLNVFLTPGVSAKDTNALILHGWRSGVKSFYYNKGLNAAQHFTRNVMGGCPSCEG
jgi:ribonucleoside-diphosphate reductase alpha chain